MKRLIIPEQAAYRQIRKRNAVADADLQFAVVEIMEAVAKQGDEALRFYNERFDDYIGDLKLDPKQIDEAEALIEEKLKEAIDRAYLNIYKYHKAQERAVERITTSKGIECWREARAIEAVGLYVPGGTAPLFSTVLMLGIPSQIAGNPKRVLCSPAGKDGEIHPAILYAAKKCGIREIFKVGGAQAIAALSFGTESIPKVDKVFGPGNSYVTEAKRQALAYGLAIDMPAGPSEVLVIADEKAEARVVAADLLSQAEHGPDSQVILISNSENFLDEVDGELRSLLRNLPRSAFALSALQQSYSIYFPNLEQAFECSNFYAPEHLILNLDNAEKWISKVKRAGSVFLGPFAAESMGDYASGTNHTLPTAAFARNYSGLSLESFQTQISFQNINKEGLADLGPSVSLMARAEGLEAHALAVEIRLKNERI